MVTLTSLTPRQAIVALLVIMAVVATLVAANALSHPGALHLLTDGPDIMSNHF